MTEPRKPRTTRKRVRPSEDAVAQQDERAAEFAPAAPTLIERDASIEKDVNRSLRDGGMVALPSELLFTVGNVPLVVDTTALDAAALALAASDDPGLWFSKNRSAIRAVVFVPMQAKVLRATPLLSVRPEADLAASHSFPVAGHLSGVHMVVGGTGAGKSTWLSKQNLDVVVRWGEPSEMYDASPNAIGVADLTEMLAVSLVLSKAGFSVAIDSFRNLVFGITGAAGQGGVSVALYAALTSINNVCAQLGVLLVAAMNPMSTDDKALLVYNNIAASVAGMTVVDNGAVASQTARTSTGRRSTMGAVPRTDVHNMVQTVDLRQTRVAEPVGVEANVRLDTDVLDHSDTESSVPRRGAKLSI